MNDISTTAKRVFNALAFANVSNLGEFHALLNQIDEPDTAASEASPRGSVAQPTASAPLVGRIQGAV